MEMGFHPLSEKKRKGNLMGKRSHDRKKVVTHGKKSRRSRFHLSLFRFQRFVFEEEKLCKWEFTMAVPSTVQLTLYTPH